MRIDPAFLRPDAFPERGPRARVELIETHVSWVMLVGGDVYKRKKPVSLGFLDFTTLEARKRACDAELALNARLAPDVYLDVLPVTAGPDGPRVGGAGDPVDWVVHMRRLDDATRADVRLAAGTLGSSDADAIAERVASFHEASRADAQTARFGAPEAIAVNVEENFSQTAGWLAQAVTAREAEEIADWQRAFLAEHAAAFHARIAAGRVRDGHGDLRLEHVYLRRDAPPVIIDCIEFADRFRYADVCSDVAFLSMDLAWHGRTDLAERLLARYALHANDYDLYGLVDFYESYRAFVRGKIALIGANDASADDARRARSLDEARRYLLLALSADRAALLRPAVIAVGGIIASGKSTLADRIALHLGAPVVEADRTRKHMVGVRPTERIDDASWKGAYDLAFTEKVYAEVLRRADVALASGRPVVLDASFRTRGMRASARALAARHGVPFRFVECRVPAAVCKARLERRAREVGVSDGRLAIFDDFMSKVDPTTELDSSEHVVIDTSGTPEQSLGQAERAVATWPERLR